MSTPFSKRHGYARQRITARESAPKQLRSDILFVIHDLWDSPGGSGLYKLCERLEPILKQSSSSLFFGKFDKALMECPWFRFYDCVEDTSRFYAKGSLKDFPWLAEQVKQFEERVNNALEENGVGWKLIEGQLQIRGEEGLEKSFQSALDNLEARGLSVARSEMHEAWSDLSRRPEADSTGAIHHAVASLESVARERAKDRKATLGKLIPKLGLSSPLDSAVAKIWGYASDSARHAREGKRPTRHEATLVVGVCAAVAAFLSEVDE